MINVLPLFLECNLMIANRPLVPFGAGIHLTLLLRFWLTTRNPVDWVHPESVLKELMMQLWSLKALFHLLGVALASVISRMLTCFFRLKSFIKLALPRRLP